MSRTGLSLCAVYAAAIAACVASGFLGGDPKSKYVLLQLPIALQSALVVELGLAPSIQGISWLTAYVVLASPVFGLLCGLGSLIDRKRPAANV